MWYVVPKLQQSGGLEAGTHDILKQIGKAVGGRTRFDAKSGAGAFSERVVTSIYALDVAED